MITNADLLHFVIIPLVISIVGMLLLARWSWGPPLAIGMAFLATFAAIQGKSTWRVPDAIDWLAYETIAIVAVAMIGAVLRWRVWVWLIASLLLASAAAGLILKFNFTNHTWTLFGGAVILLVVAISAAIIWSSVFPARNDPIASLLAMSMTAGIGGLAVMALADQTIGQCMAGMGVALLPPVAMTILRRRRGKPMYGLAGLSLVFSVLLIVALVASIYLSDVPRLDTILIAIAPPLFWFTGLIPLGRLRSWQTGIIRLLIAAIPLGFAMTHGIRSVQENHDPASDNTSESI